jgi:putative phosphoribosyl transferase
MGNSQRKEILIEDNSVKLRGDLVIPEDASSIIVFAQGGGSSRNSSHDKYVAERLSRSGFATLMVNLLTEREERDEQFSMHRHFDADMLSTRLCSAVDWLSFNEQTQNLSIGIFAASISGAAALICAAKRRLKIAAIVSRSGRPDLAEESLPYVLCPTLFLVGGFDPKVMALNEKALHMMNCHKEIEIIPGATHAFEEAGKLDLVATMATWWFARYCTLQFAPGLNTYEMVDGLSPSMIERVDNNLGHHK